MKLPALHFYVGDWMKAPEVRALSFAAKGLWIDMLCLMFESPRRGYLQTKTGQPVSLAQLARMTGGATDEVAHLLQELDDAGVFSKNEDSTIYCRRMVRDESVRAKCTEAGKRGGNPTLRKTPKTKRGLTPRVNPTLNPKANPPLNPSPEDEVVDESDSLQPKVEDIPERLRTPEFRNAWKDWLSHRSEIHKALKPTAQRNALAKFDAWGASRAVAAIRHSIANGWEGCFEPDEKSGRAGGLNVLAGLQQFLAEGEAHDAS
jgi:hypothetical protein